MTTTYDPKTTTALDVFCDEHLYDYSLTWNHYSYALPHNALTFGCSDEMARGLAAHGNSFFGAQEMRLFRTRVDQLYDGRFLVFSNRHDYSGAQRTYHVMWAYDVPESERWSTDKLETTFYSLNTARRAARKLAALVKEAEAL